MVLILSTFLLIYYLFGWSFSVGAATYAKENNDGTAREENCWQTIIDEFAEFVDAVKQRSYFNAFMEFFDVVLAIIKFFVVALLPKKFIFHWVCWTLVFPFVIPAAIKLGHRYNTYGCIRNHARDNLNHHCVVNKYLLKKKLIIRS